MLLAERNGLMLGGDNVDCVDETEVVFSPLLGNMLL